MREQLRKCIFWRSSFYNVIFAGEILKECFWGSNFKNVFFEIAILKNFFFDNVLCEGVILNFLWRAILRKQFGKFLFWGSNIHKYLNWLLIGMVVDLDGCLFQSWIVPTYWTSVLIHLNLQGFSFCSSKLRFEFWFIHAYRVTVLINVNLHFSFYSSELMVFQFWFI